MDFSTLLFFIAAACLGAGIGAASSSNCFATTFGSNILSYKKSLLLVVIFLIIGSVVQGNPITKTIGKEIVDVSFVSSHAITSIMFGAALLLFLYAMYGIPASTTQTVIGSLLGVSLIEGVPIKWGGFFFLFLFWILTPFIAAIFGMISHSLMLLLLKQTEVFKFEHYLKYCVVGSMMFLSYAFGANHVGLIAGLATGNQFISLPWMTFFAAIFIGIGALFFSKNVTLTMGRKITELDPRMAFSSQTGSALTLYIMALSGIPISATQTTVGGITGTGLSKSIALIDKSQLWKIFRGWVLTPVWGAFLGICAFYVLGAVF